MNCWNAKFYKIYPSAPWEGNKIHVQMLKGK